MILYYIERLESDQVHTTLTQCMLTLTKMSEALIQIGVVGCADIGRKVSRAINLSPNATICSVASRNYDKAAAFAAANGYPLTAKVYGNYEALLEDPDVDAVYMPLPTSLHLKWAVLAAQNKKHLLLEKPVALDVAEFDEIVGACEDNGVQFMDNTMWVHNPRTAKMAQFFNDPHRFGQLKSVIYMSIPSSTIIFGLPNKFVKLLLSQV